MRGGQREVLVKGHALHKEENRSLKMDPKLDHQGGRKRSAPDSRSASGVCEVHAGIDLAALAVRLLVKLHHQLQLLEFRRWQFECVALMMTREDLETKEV